MDVGGFARLARLGVVAEALDPTSDVDEGEARAPAPKAIRPRKAREAQKAKPITPPNSGESVHEVGKGKRKRATKDETAALKTEVLKCISQLNGEVKIGAVLSHVKGKTRAAVSHAIQLLLAEGELKKKGERKNTVYWVA
jgi:negative regulator of replication initiation